MNFMPDITPLENTQIALFKGKQIRKKLQNGEWWFSVVDIVGALTDSPDAGAYWRKLKQRLNEEGSEVVTFCHGLKLEAADGKNYETERAGRERDLRIAWVDRLLQRKIFSKNQGTRNPSNLKVFRSLSQPRQTGTISTYFYV